MENVRLSINISWVESRKDFIDYLKVQEYNEAFHHDSCSLRLVLGKISVIEKRGKVKLARIKDASSRSFFSLQPF